MDILYIVLKEIVWRFRFGLNFSSFECKNKGVGTRVKELRKVLFMRGKQKKIDWFLTSAEMIEPTFNIANQAVVRLVSKISKYNEEF